jgi:hypothetical protein
VSAPAGAACLVVRIRNYFRHTDLLSIRGAPMQ